MCEYEKSGRGGGCIVYRCLLLLLSSLSILILMSDTTCTLPHLSY